MYNVSLIRNNLFEAMSYDNLVWMMNRKLHRSPNGNCTIVSQVSKRIHWAIALSVDQASTIIY